MFPEENCIIDGEFYHAKLMCFVKRQSYDFASHTGAIHFPDACCCDMRGCLELFLSIDKMVERIATFNGGGLDTVYCIENGEWVAKEYVEARGPEGQGTSAVERIAGYTRGSDITPKNPR